MRKVLIVSLAFPPVNASGCVRVGKLAKYLPEFGWEPIVLTADRSLHPSLTLPVETTASNIINVSQASRSMNIINYVNKLPLLKAVLPHPITWYLPALKAGHKIMMHYKIDALFSSYYPCASHFIASRLQKQAGIPWIAEFRDLWSQNPYHSQSNISCFLEKKTEKKIMRRSCLLISVSEGLAKQLHELHSKETSVIPNGFDEEDYLDNVPLTTKFTITYTGNIYRGKRDPTSLFEAAAQLAQEGIISSSNFEMRFFGSNVVRILSPLTRKYSIQSLVRLENTIPFRESIKRQKESTILLLLSWNDPRDKDTYTGKVFEYIGAKRPILAIAYKTGVIDELLQETKTGVLANDARTIGDILLRWLTEWQEHGKITSCWNPDATSISKYTRREGTRKLACLLNEQCLLSNRGS